MKKRSNIMKDLSVKTQQQLGVNVSQPRILSNINTIKGKVDVIETGDLVLNDLQKKNIVQLIIRGDEYTLTYDKDDKKIKNITSNTADGSTLLLAVSLLFSSCIPLSGVSCNDEITLEMLDTNTFRIAFKRPNVFIYFVKSNDQTTVSSQDFNSCYRECLNNNLARFNYCISKCA